MIAEELYAAVLAVPGVASVEVALRQDDMPVVRVWTDESRNDSEIHNDVTDVIAIHGYGSGTLETGRAALEARITDTVGSMLPDDVGRGPMRPIGVGLAKLSIEETGDAVVAVASDASGRTARADVGDGADAFLLAVTNAVAALRGFTPAPMLVSVEDRFIAGVDVVSVLIETNGERYAGAAVVRGGRPFSVGRAIDAALATAV